MGWLSYLLSYFSQFVHFNLVALILNPIFACYFAFKRRFSLNSWYSLIA